MNWYIVTTNCKEEIFIKSFMVDVGWLIKVHDPRVNLRNVFNRIGNIVTIIYSSFVEYRILRVLFGCIVNICTGQS